MQRPWLLRFCVVRYGFDKCGPTFGCRTWRLGCNSRICRRPWSVSACFRCDQRWRRRRSCKSGISVFSWKDLSWTIASRFWPVLDDSKSRSWTESRESLTMNFRIRLIFLPDILRKYRGTLRSRNLQEGSPVSFIHIFDLYFYSLILLYIISNI